MAADLSKRLEGLSPEKRALLLEKLRLRGQEHAKAGATESGPSARWQPIPKRADQAAYPLSFAQQRLWILSQLEPDSPFYNIPLALRLSGPLNVPALERALNEIVARHEVLRAHFTTERGNPIQVIAPELRLSLQPEVVPGPDFEAAAQEIAVAEARRPFDLMVGPLVRSRLLWLGDGPAGPQHMVLLTFHHIVMDGWSTGVFVRELAVLYRAFAAEIPGGTAAKSPLPPLALQYADYAAWQREQLQGDRFKAELAYWREQLSGIAPMLELPTDRPRPAVQTFSGTVFPFELSAELSGKLRKLAHDEDATLYQVLLAAFQVLLHRYSNQDDICVGTPIANRTRADVEGLIGFFVNTLVMRSTFTANPNFREVLGSLKERALSAQSHQDVPFEMLVDDGVTTGNTPQRNMAITPIFQVMFTLEQRERDLAVGAAASNKPSHSALQGVTITPVETHSGTAKFDMTLFMIDQEGRPLCGSFEYNTDLWHTSTVGRMVGHYRRLLEEITNTPDLPVGLLAMLSADEERQLLYEWNDTATDYPRDRCLHELFEEQVSLRPNARAVSYGDSTLTYADLNREANRLAHWLQELGVGPGVLVGVYLERGIDLIIALLGIIKAGGAYLPLDIEYPAERLAFMLADGRARVLITQSNLEELLLGGKAENPRGQDAAPRPAPQMAVIRMDSDRAKLTMRSAANPKVAVRAGDLAYVIYTSGSTGVPKGVSIPQQAVARLVFNTNYINLEPSDRIAQASNASFDAATFEIWGALLRGGELIGVDKELALSPKAFAAFLRRREISILFLTTALFNLIAADEPTAFNTLNCVMFGGEAVDPRWVRRVLEYGGPGRLLHVYGPTESTTFASWYPVREVAANATTVPIGRPLSNTQIYILDRYFRLAPVGVSGELCIGGDGLAVGYLNRPELTAEKFTPNPFDGCGSPRLYRTGDLVRYLPDGSIEFQGRIDHQVKVRGFRIELGEIESVLREHHQVEQVFVMVRADSAPSIDGAGDATGAERIISSERKVVAYIVPRGGAGLPAVADLRSHLKQHLPDHMVPAAFVFLESLPINPNGKLDRNALPKPDYAAINTERPYIAPRSPVERFLAAKWQEVLGIEKVSVTDNFFELGGNSLQAAVLTNRMQEELGASAHVRALFMAPTIADLATYMDEYYPDAVARMVGIGADAANSGKVPESTAGSPPAGYTFQEKARISAQIDEAKVAQFREIVPPLPERIDTPEERARLGDEGRNPPAVFVLSPPRSGSTLLRVMLAGNPHLFAPPELDLMSFNTLAERKAAFSGKFEFWLEGPIKAIMELRKCSADEAEAIMAGFEREGWTTKKFYRQLQQWIAESLGTPNANLAPRLLVDKTPVYPMDYNILARMEQDFTDARYIHLVRHPFATTYSFMEAKLEDIFFRWDHPWSMRELAELVYLVSHRNILKFLEQIPPERQHRVWFEELVGDAPNVMHGVCDFLQVGFHPDMLEPYKGDKMTSGIRPGHQMVGDFKFYLRNKIDPKAADRWKRFKKGDRLADETWEVARRFNYEPPSEDEGEGSTPAAAEQSEAQNRAPIQPRAAGETVVLSYAQERLWFLDQFERGGAGADGASAAGAFYNVPAAVRLIGTLDIAALQAALTTIVQRHEVLRTTFATVDGVARPVIAEHLAVALPVIDLSGLPAEQREAEAMRLAAQEARRPFDLARGPLLRAALLDLGPGPAGHETVALITMHHIASDGWSSNVFIKELATLYGAFVRQVHQPEGPDTPGYTGEGILTPLPIQYADFAAWQRKWFEGFGARRGENGSRASSPSPLQKQLAYWTEHLRGLPPMLELPTDRPRPAVQTLNGERFTFTLPEELTAKVRALARSEGATVFMTLLAAFQTLLMRYTGQEDIAVGTPIAGRNHPEIANLIGFFVNTLVMRGDLSAAPGQAPLTFRQLLKRTQATAIKAYENQDVPFETLVEVLLRQEAQPQRDMSHTPLFQAMFALQDAPLQTLSAPGLAISPLQPDTKTAKFDLMLNVVERTDVMRCALEYNTDLFNASTATRMAQHLRVLLEAIVARPDAAVATLPVLTTTERQMMLVDWNDTAVDVDTESTLVAHFEERARLTPDAPAVVAETEGRTASLTYGELDAAADRIAQQLTALGAGPESIVGLMAERSLELIAGVVGIWKAGAAYLPLDPSYPADRLTYMLTDSGARLLVTQARFAGQQVVDGLGVVLLDGKGAAPDGAAPRAAGADNLAYVIYTSGSTGKPKGVAVTHRTALNLAIALHRAAYGANDRGRPLRVSLNAPLSFDASVQQLVMLTLGHTLVVIPQDVRTDAAGLLAFIRRQQLDQLDCVPSQLKLLLAEGLLAPDAAWTPSIVFPGGEALDEPIWATLAAAPHTAFYNMYGPTECTVDSTTAAVGGGVSHSGANAALRSPKRPTIGRPLANARVYVLDRNLEPVPIGVQGELFIAGAGVSRGYLNRAELTAERFLPDPFVGDLTTDLPGFGNLTGLGPRMYRTGDRVRWLPNGTLEFLGRVDFQVKVRGFRIELGEIEETLRNHAGIREAVVLVESSGPVGEGAQRLVAYVVPESAGPQDAPSGQGSPAVTAAELRQHLLGTLPEYMVPSAFMLLDAMPLTPNGKIDRKALLKLSPDDVVRADTGLAYIAPSGHLEQTLAEIFARVLGLERVGANDNFFELGGDSILTIQVVARAGQAGINLTPRQIFQSPTVGQLALMAELAPLGAVQAEQGEVEGDVPLTPIQRRFFEIRLPRPDHWNQSLMVAATVQLKPEALRMAVAAVVRHHDALRLRFRRVDGQWRQANAGISGEAPFEFIDLAGLEEPARAEALREHTLRLQESLDIGRGPLFRVAYFDFGPQASGRLLTIVHHLAVDRVSWPIVLEDLVTAYEQASQVRATGQAHGIHLPLKTTAFRDWARQLEAYAQSAELLTEMDFWLRLKKEPIPELVLDCPGGSNLESDISTVARYLEEDETVDLVQQAGKAYGTEVNELLLAALALAFERWAGQPAAFVEVEGHGRQPEVVAAGAEGHGASPTAAPETLNLARTVGWFTAVYPLLLQPRTAAVFVPDTENAPQHDIARQAIMAIKEQVRATPNGGIGYGLLRYLRQDVGVRATMKALPHPQVSFNYLGHFIQDATQTAGVFGPAPENSGPDHAAENERQYVLDVTASVFAGKLRLEFTYSDAQFAAETIETLGDFYIDALRGLIQHCLSPEAGGYTRSDFADAGLSDEGVQNLLLELGEIDG